MAMPPTGKFAAASFSSSGHNCTCITAGGMVSAGASAGASQPSDCASWDLVAVSASAVLITVATPPMGKFAAASFPLTVTCTCNAAGSTSSATRSSDAATA